jgi:hypothetical protein
MEKIIMDYFDKERMTGKEQYEIIGNLLNKEQLACLIYACTDCILTANCVEKACITKAHTSSGLLVKQDNWKIAIGSIKIFSKDMQSTFGHNFNPPNELHCWLENDKKEIIDIALPGVIIRGLRAKDELGSFLAGRTPVVLAGEAPNWIIYKTENILCRKVASK